MCADKAVCTRDKDGRAFGDITQLVAPLPSLTITSTRISLYIIAVINQLPITAPMD